VKTKRNLIQFCLLYAALSIGITNAEATMVNGQNYAGFIFTNTIADSYTFTANVGDDVTVGLGTSNFMGYLEIDRPNGSVQTTGGTAFGGWYEFTATNSGTFTVLVSSSLLHGTGPYVVRLAEVPESFVVPAGDEGGSLTNGENHFGTIDLGDIDMWTFSASKGDNIYLRLATTNFVGGSPKFQVNGPDGKVIQTPNVQSDSWVQFTPTNSGTFTVTVKEAIVSTYGTYVLRLAQSPEPFVVTAGDEGGVLSNNATHYGTIDRGDVDMWMLTAFKGSLINLQLKATNFTGYYELDGPDGSVLQSTTTSISYTATNSGIFTVLLRADFADGSGTYGLTASGISSGLKISSPAISGTNFTFSGTGGTSNAVFVIYSATNIATPFGLWTPILTNHFDQFGVFISTNSYNPVLQKFFRFVVP
jgi:hypothetical protein